VQSVTLKGQVLRELRLRLTDPETATSDENIAAVLAIAAHEVSGERIYFQIFSRFLIPSSVYSVIQVFGKLTWQPLSVW
jgi:hypothetical protein